MQKGNMMMEENIMLDGNMVKGNMVYGKIWLTEKMLCKGKEGIWCGKMGIGISGRNDE
jgi:hypothetical protein